MGSTRIDLISPYHTLHGVPHGGISVWHSCRAEGVYIEVTVRNEAGQVVKYENFWLPMSQMLENEQARRKDVADAALYDSDDD